MSYIFEIVEGTVNNSPDGLKLELPGYTSFGDFAEEKRDVFEFNVQDDESGSANLTSGDYVAPVIDGVPMPSTYWGEGEISFGPVGQTHTGGQFEGLSISLNISPVTGGLLESKDGKVYFVADDTFDINNQVVTGTISFGGKTVPVDTTYGNLASYSRTLFPENTNLSNWLFRNIAGVADTAEPISSLDSETAYPLDPSEVGDIVCFAAGTRIATVDGDVAIDGLSVGDTVLTKDNGEQAIRWISSTVVSAAALAANPKLRPIRIKAGVLGNNTPTADLLVSPNHRVLLRSSIAMRLFGAPEVLVAAKQLLQIDGVDIADDLEEVTYFHMLFDRHEVVISNGAETESLFTGPETIKTVGKAAAEEIFALFPELREAFYAPVAVRPLLSGRLGRKLVTRHIQHNRALVM